MTVQEMINRAFDVAEAAHRNQVDKGGHPYIGHPIRVAANVARMEPDFEMYVVAILHDVVEDTPVTLGDLRDMFPDRVVDAVDAISRRKDEGETFFDYIRRCAKNDLARKVKIADIVDNSDIARVRDDEEMVKEVRGMIKSRYLKALDILGVEASYVAEFDSLAQEMVKDAQCQ